MPFSPPILRLRPIALLASALQLLGAASARAQSEEPSDRFYGTLEVTAVELILDVRDAEGGVPADLGADDFRVLEDGRPVTVVGFEPLRQSSLAERDARPGEAAARAPAASRSWHVVAYFDTVLSSSRSIRRAAEFLASQAGRLTDLGTVQIVVADSEAQVWLQPTRSARLVEQTLQRMARELTGRDAMRRHRKSFLATLQEQGRLAGARPVTFNANRGIGQRDAAGGPAGGAGGSDDAPVLNEAPLIDRRVQVRWGATQELAMLRGQHDLMMAWLGRDLGAGPRALLVVNDGYDLEPQRFYLTSVSDPSDAADLYSLLQSQSAAPDAEQLARSLASRGWVAINLALGGLEAASSISAEQTGQGRLGEITAGNPQAVADLPTALVFQPLAPLNMAADATGGETLTGLGELPRSLDRLAERFLLTYQVQRTADGGLHRIEVHAQRPGLEVRTQRWSGTESLESVASARARRLLDGGIERGDLPLIAALALDPEAAGEEAPRHGRLQVRLDLRPVADSLAGFASASLRFTLAASFADGEPFVRHQAITGQDLAGLDAWTFTSPVSLPASIEKVAVVFEILDGGAWGGSLASLVQGG
ncbi:MAG TPA: hypothetical protein VLA66_05200, partial [Thermoanaerobaculia bacterium]|nr:hypothetical protein [Thermoanaerobaculia bacterium]